jgi:hypothetical protein
MFELWHHHKLALLALPLGVALACALTIMLTVRGYGLDEPVDAYDREEAVSSRTTIIIVYRRHPTVIRTRASVVNMRNTRSRTTGRSGGFGFGK